VVAILDFQSAQNFVMDRLMILNAQLGIN
jgi:hypothetical protein